MSESQSVSLETLQATEDLPIDGAIVTQEGIRDLAYLMNMIQFVKEGGFYHAQNLAENHKKTQSSCPPKLITVAKFPDDALYIWDGHHRVFSILMGQRDYIAKSEYQILPLTYEKAMTPNFETGFVTPFDPRTEVRLRDFMQFKTTMLKLANSSEEKKLEKIRKKKHLYLKPRDVYTVRDYLGQHKL